MITLFEKSHENTHVTVYLWEHLKQIEVNIANQCEDVTISAAELDELIPMLTEAREHIIGYSLAKEERV